MRPKIAVFSGPNATVLNSPPLIGRTADDPSSGTLRPQRIATPAVVYIEPMSAHPLESDAAELYGTPNCLLDEQGNEHSPSEPPRDGRHLRAVHRILLHPEDGLFLLPYVSTDRDGVPWQSAGLTENAPEGEQRQTFYPDASRLYDEIDRFGIDERGRSRMLSSRATFTFFRALPSGGYRRGLAAALRTDVNAEGHVLGNIDPESRGSHFYPYYPRHLQADPLPAAFVEATNLVQDVLASGDYVGGQWLEGSPEAEESLYWFNLLLDIAVPLVGHVAQRPHGTLSCDGDRNIVNGVDYITSGAWTSGDGDDAVGVVLIADQLVYTAREVAKTDARPGNYEATGGIGGVVGRVDNAGTVAVAYRPTYRFTHRSQLNISRLPDFVQGHGRSGSAATIRVRDKSGKLHPESMPVVTIFKHGRYGEACCGPAQVQAWLEHCEAGHPLAGIVGEGKNPYGSFDPATDRALRRAALSGVPVVKCGRGGTKGVTPRQNNWAVSGNNLTASKARILLMASLLKLGALPAAKDPSNPEPEEESAVAAAIQRYQEVFDSH